MCIGPRVLDFPIRRGLKLLHEQQLFLDNLSQGIPILFLFFFQCVVQCACIRKESKMSNSYDYWLLYILLFIRYLIKLTQPKTCLGPMCQSGAEPCKQ